MAGRPVRWKKLSPGWEAQRKKEGTWGTGPFSQPILQRFGTLRQSIGTVRRIGAFRLEYGTNLRKAPGLQFGRGPVSGIATVKPHFRFVQGKGKAFGGTRKTRTTRGATKTRFRAGARHVAVKEHKRRFRFGPVPARPFIMFQDEDVKRIVNMAAIYAFDMKRTATLGGGGGHHH